MAAVGQAASAQDSHYWSHQYGGRANLLTGAVVGGIGDASAAYYNPGGLALTTEDEIFLGTSVFDMTNLRIEPETGDAANLNSGDLGRAPSFIGGIAPVKVGRHHFAYSIFKRASFQARIDGTSLVNDPGADVQSVYARTTFDTNLSERWFGGTWSYPVSKIFGFGISTFLARRQQYLEIERDAEALLGSGSTVMLTDVDYYKYYHFRILWKAGAQIDLERIKFGLTLTTPGVKLFGSGERIINQADAGVGEVEGRDDYMAADFQESVPATYKSPISAAFGLSMIFDHRAVHVSVEAFDTVDPYEVLDLQPAYSQSTGLQIADAVVTSAESVVNSAFGIEEFFSDRLTGFLSVSTDYSAAPPEEETNLSVTRWDLYHVTGGATLKLGNTVFILGLGYAGGSQRSDRIAAPEGSGLARILDDPVPSEMEYRRLKLIVGFSLSP